MSGPAPKPEDATFGIVTALAHEFAAAQVIFGSTEVAVVDRPGSGRAYDLASVPSLGGGEHVVAIIQLADMGNTAAAIRVTNMLTDCSSIKYVIMVGIAGAVPSPKNSSKHVRLGDIVVCDLTGIIQYDFGARKPSGTTPRERPRSPAIALIDAHKRLQVKSLRGVRPWEQALKDAIQVLAAR